MIIVTIYKTRGIQDVYPITIMGSNFHHNQKSKMDEEKKQMYKIEEFFSDQFKYVGIDEETIQDVAPKEIDKYICESIKEFSAEYIMNKDTSFIRPDLFDSADFINEIFVIRGNIYLPGDELQSIEAMIKLFFNELKIRISVR